MKNLLLITLISSIVLFSCNKNDNDNINAFDPELVGHWKLSNLSTAGGSPYCNWENGQVDLYISESGSYNIEFTTSNSSSDHEYHVGNFSSIINNSKLIISFSDGSGDESRVFNYSIENNTLTITQDLGQPVIKWFVSCSDDYGQGFGTDPELDEIELNNLVKQ